jgi:hypothetical protein
MKGKRIIALLSFVFMLALALSTPQTLAAGERDSNFKGHDGTWLVTNDAGTNASYVTCSPTNDSSSRSYSCVADLFANGLHMTMFFDGFFTGHSTYRERGIGYFENSGYHFIVVATVAGRTLDDNTDSAYMQSNVYMDMNGDGVPSDWELVVPGVAEHITVRRMISVFPNIPFPNYPPAH